MMYPSGVTEQSFLIACSGAMKKFNQTHTFGYFDFDDIRQELYILAMSGLEKYDPNRPLENFLATHLQNRWINLKRDKYHRADPPCKLCHNNTPCASAPGQKGVCEKYKKWAERNGRKANLTKPQPFDEWDHARDNHSQAEMREIETIIDVYLPIELRKDYLKMREDCFVPKPRKRLVQSYCKLILASGVYHHEDWGSEDGEF
jgi:DNA-directed RNA polymerase specialized sigma24 family protein